MKTITIRTAANGYIVEPSVDTRAGGDVHVFSNFEALVQFLLAQIGSAAAVPPHGFRAAQSDGIDARQVAPTPHTLSLRGVT